MEERIPKTKSAKNLSGFGAFRESVQKAFLHTFYHKPQSPAPVSRALVCNNHTSVIDVVAGITVTVALSKTKQTQAIVFLAIFMVAFVATGFIARLENKLDKSSKYFKAVEGNSTYYKAIVFLRSIILLITLAFVYVVSNYFFAVQQICLALDTFYTSPTGDALTAITECNSLLLSYIITFTAELIVLISRILNVFFFYRGYQYFRKILAEEKQKKKRKDRYSTVQKRREMEKKEGYYNYNKNRKL